MIGSRKIKAKSLKVTSVFLLLLMSIQCLPGYAWGYDWHAQIKGFVSAQVSRSDEIIEPNEQKIKTTVQKGTGWIAEQYKSGFTYLEDKTGLGEENSLYKAAKHYTLHNVGFNLGLVNGAGVVASELYSFVAKLPTAPERLVNFGYKYAENPAHYQAMVKNGTLAVAGTLLNPKPLLNSLYGYGKSAYLEAAKDPLTLGNLHGEAVVYVGSLLLPLPMTKSKAVTTAGKLGTTAKAGTVAEVGTAVKAGSLTKAASFTGTGRFTELAIVFTPAKLTELFTKARVRTSASRNNEAAILFPQTQASTTVETIPTLKNLVPLQKEYMVRNNYKHDPELAQILQGLINQCDLRIRVPDELTLTKILKDGRIKTQLEVHSSRGYLCSDTRKRLSNKLFGTESVTKDSEYEVYGYLGDKLFVGEIENYILKQYGEVIVTLKWENLFPRTTFTLGDSLNMCNQYIFGNRNPAKMPLPSKLDHIFTACGERDTIAYIKNVANSKKEITLADIAFNPQKFIQHPDAVHYIETQYHGKVLISDIESVTIINKHQPPKPNDELLQLLKENKIKTYWLDDCGVRLL
jgi:hypothetical protein